MRHLPFLVLLAACTGDPEPGANGPWLDVQPPLLEDLDPDPMVFEADLVASETTWSYAPDLAVTGLAYGGVVPGPLIRVPLGARVLVHFRNDLPAGFDTTIHWHGIEGNNAADGTPVTQMPTMPGESFDYDFVVTRPGLYWYHPHARGAQGVFEGLYAPLVVDDPSEPELARLGILPAEERILVLSDLSEYEGRPSSVEVDSPMEIMNGTEGEHLLVNGREDPIFELPAAGAVRLRIVNTSITRFWRLSVPDHVLYRIGGEGGLLDTVRVEGGSVPGRARALADGADLGPVEVPLGYARGEILLAPAERADVVLVLDGEPGDALALRWEDFARGRHGMWMQGDEMVMGDLEDDGTRSGETVATLRLVAGGEPWSGEEGTPILGAVDRSVGAVDTRDALDWTGDAGMVMSEQMDMWQEADGLWQMSTQFFVDGESWHPDHMRGPEQPEAETAVRARLGDTLLWEIENESEMAHPFHLHGFSYQPVSFVRTDEEAGTVTTWDLGYDEFEDTTNIPGTTSLLLRVRLDDPVGDGGGAGRWMRHCHILQHGENGMMSELIVEP